MRSIFIGIIFFLASVFAVNAEGKLNAGLVSDIWYDNLEITQGIDINIYTAFYNQSAEKFSGKVIFKIGNDTLSTRDFSADPKETKVLSETWKSIVGKHKVSVEIIDENSVLNSKYVEKVLEVKNKTAFGNLEKIEGVNSVIENVKTIVKNINESTSTIADNLENKKISNNTQASSVEKNTSNKVEDKKEEKSTNTENDPEPEVLGVSIERFLPENNKTVARVYDTSITGISWIVRNWQWAAIALFIIFVIIVRRKRD